MRSHDPSVEAIPDWLNPERGTGQSAADAQSRRRPSERFAVVATL
jgi:hypothetical protein